MSSPVQLPLTALSPESQQSLIHKQRTAHSANNLPSPPLSVSDDHNLLDFDPTDLAFDVGNTPTPESTALVSPKSTAISPINTVGPSFTFDPLAPNTYPTQVSPLSAASSQGTTAAEALSQHHLERYLHYKRLAAQATAEANIASIQLLNPGLIPASDQINNVDLVKNDMIALQAQSNGQANVNNGNAPSQQQHSFWNATFQLQQAHQTALHAQAQATAHLQAHANATAARNASMGAYFMGSNQQQPQNAGPVPQPPSIWSRQSVSTSVSGGSPPYPSTPIYASSGLPMPIIKGNDDMEEDELASDGKMPSPTGVTNLHGGGRGYIPGKTPDDPRKRHKCTICGRGFARAFNLKSHLQTHDPGRPKPHQCPHHMCKRSFSRLHDLERHRQGIHSDGPLVDAKRQGVSPSVVRAQSRMRSRAESGGLI